MTERSDLIRNGYTTLPGAVPTPLVKAALEAIEHDRDHHTDPNRQQEYNNQSYCPRLRDAPVILDLLHRSPLLGTLRALLKPRALNGTDYAQIAIRQAYNHASPISPAPHLDGFPTGLNGMNAETGVQPFTALVGVFLQGEPGPFAGNFTVWAGEHTESARHFARRGRRALHEPLPELPVGGGEPRQLQVAAGDAVIAHYLLPHAAAVNTSGVDRVAVYFRLGWAYTPSQRWGLMSDLWGAWRVE